MTLPRLHRTLVASWSCALLVACTAPVFAQIPADRDVLLNAEGAGQGKYAELNGYPGPKHVLDLGGKLGLTDHQRQAVQALYAEMAKRAKDIGKQIVRIEEELNASFTEGLISEKAVRDNCEEIGRLRGKLRAVHLTAHLKCKSVLTEKQTVLYRKLRSGGDH